MENRKNIADIPPEGMKTPHGYLYNPPTQGKQVIFLAASFFTAIFLGYVISSIPGDLSQLAQGVIFFIYILIFFIGYSVWASMVAAMLFTSIKLPLMKIIFGFLRFRRKPGSLKELLPSREKVMEIMVRSQKASIIFFIVSWVIGIAGGLLTAFFSTEMNGAILFVLVALSSVVFGYGLYYFGRRGWMPFPEE